MIAVLFARRDSIYRSFPECDVWDAERDARLWPGGSAIVAHPPCRAWGSLRHFARPGPGEKEMAIWAIGEIRKWGGVLEHPAASGLFDRVGAPRPGRGMDQWGGWTLGVRQLDFGHACEKKTILYIVGCAPRSIPPLPISFVPPSHIIGSSRRHSALTGASQRMREATPPRFAEWLVALAANCAHA